MATNNTACVIIYPPYIARSVAEDTPPADVLALLDDEYARSILRHTNSTPMPARQLSEELDVSRSTVYHRINRLREIGLLAESTELDPDGNHRSVYRAQLDHVVVELVGDEFVVTVNRSEHPADTFTNMWEDL